jgi:iron complex outermembrane receptor protein
MFKRNVINVAALATLSAAALSAVAQQQPQTIERVEITGSRIRQIDTETAQPVLKVTAADIQKTGLVTVGDIVNQLTSAGTPAFSKGQVLASNREAGGQFVNLRGLGAQRLLVLVNGKRWSQSVAGFTDLSTIPASMVERMELLKDGASSIYGSDAVAGVVNFILKKSMEGGEVSYMYSQNELGDGKSQDVSLTYGANGEKSSLMFGFTYNKVDPIWARSRAATRFTNGPGTETSALGGGPWGRIRPVSSTGGAGTAFDLVLNHTGTYDGVGTGQASNNRANYHKYTGAAADLYNSTQDMMFAMGSELRSIFTKGSIDVTPDIRVVSTAMYADRESIRTVAGYPLQSGAQASYPVYVDKNSYFNPLGNFGVGVAPGAGVDVFFNRRTIEVPRTTINNARTLHADAAIEGDVTIAGRAWTWSAGVNYSQVNGNIVQTGNANLVNLKKALGPSFLNAQGVVQCGTAAAPIALTDCVPFDILGGPSASTPAALNYIMHVGGATYGSTVHSLHADVSGEVVKLPGGMMGVAAGVEKREVKGYDRPGPMEQQNLTSDLAGKATIGNYEVNEAYVELNVPLLKNLPFVHALSLNLATRYSDYSNFGDTTNSKASLSYRPTKDMLVRATWAEGFRAPTLGDISGGGSQSFDTYIDPCDTEYGDAKTNAATQARCAAAGVPAGFRQKNQAGNAVTASTGGQTPFPFQAGAGNAFLKPETAVTKTAGIVFSPASLPGFSATVDWYKITINNRITAVSANYILSQCYVNGVSEFCGLSTRDGTGQVNDLRRGNANLGEQFTEGWDLGLNYRFPATSFGRFGFKSETTYVSKYQIKSTPTANWVEYAGDYGTPHFKSNLTIDWGLNNWGASFTTRYTGRVRSACYTATIQCNNPTTGWSGSATRHHVLAEQIFNDLSVSYKTPWKGELRVGANNILDVKPRMNYSAVSSATFVDADVPVDRSFFVRYSQQF